MESYTRAVQYAIRMPANTNLELAIEDILLRSPGRPSRTLLVRYRALGETRAVLLAVAGCCWLLLAESHLTRRLFGAMLQQIWALPVPTG